jgi:hypothetical protein
LKHQSPLPSWERELAQDGFGPDAQECFAGRCRTLDLGSTPLRFLVAVCTMDRPSGLRRLAESLIDSRERFGYRVDGLGLLVLDNSASPVNRAANHEIINAARERSVPSAIAPISTRSSLFAKLHRQGFCPPLGPPPAPIGVARMALTACLLDWHQRTDLMNLPHQDDGAGPVAVWMLDDDMSLDQLVVHKGRRFVTTATSLLHRLSVARTLHPEAQVLLGGNTGDPPIPAADCLRHQLCDLAANLERMADCAPNDPWSPPPNDRSVRDFYYDLTESGTVPADSVFWWEPTTVDAIARQAATELLEAAPRLVHGSQVTRPLTWSAPGLAVHPDSARGGNTIFFDQSALFCAPYPCWSQEDGTATRRADGLWALLAARAGVRVMSFAAPTLHGRWGNDGSSPLAGGAPPNAKSVAAHVAAQQAGTVCCRLVKRGLDEAPEVELHEAALELLCERTSRFERNLAALPEVLHRLRTAAQTLQHRSAWLMIPELTDKLAGLETVLGQLERAYSIHQQPLNLRHDVQGLVAFTHGLGSRANGMEGNWT